MEQNNLEINSFTPEQNAAKVKALNKINALNERIAREQAFRYFWKSGAANRLVLHNRKKYFLKH
jgi:hypothetical protein